MSSQCAACDRQFGSAKALGDHCKAKRHGPYCEPCQRWFVNSEALQAHLRDSPRHYSDSDDYDSDDDSDERSVDDSDDSDEELEEEPYCQACDRWFVDIPSLHTHLKESSRHNWCFVCSCDFNTKQSLLNHEKSLAHKNRDMKCPFCEEMFKSPSGVAFHVESGCHKITRHQVTAAVHALRIVPTISISRRLEGPVSPPTSETRLIATEESFNGTAYQCCLNDCRRTFATLAALNSHLNSPAHDRDEFKCPKCKKEFKLISGLVQHIESGTCKVAKLKKVEAYYEDLTAAFTRALKL